MRHHFSPPQLPFSSLPIPPLPPTLRIPPPPLPSPFYPSHLPRPSAPSHTITRLFFYSSTSFSIFPFSPPSSPLLTLLSPVSPSFFPFSSSLHHPALSIYGPVIFFFVVLLSLPALLVDIVIFLLFFSFSPFSFSSSCTFCSSSPNSYSPSAPTGKVGCEKLKTLCALNQLTKPRYAHINIYLGQVNPRWGKLSRGTSCPKLCGSTCPIMTLACPQ